jgi:rubrerythrin
LKFVHNLEIDGNRKEVKSMKRYSAIAITILTAVFALFVGGAFAQYGGGMGGGGMGGGGMMGGRGYGYGMGRGMMGYPITPDVPDKLPIPKSQEWTQKLQEVLDLERLSYDQYTADAEKFDAYMPYMMVIPQEEDHVRAIERLFAAYKQPADGKPAAVVETKTITEALELCVKMEQDLIPRYEWLVKNAGDRESAGILNEILLQTRYHLVMFDHALRMGGRMGPGMMRGGGTMGRGYGGYGMGPGMMGGGYGGYGMMDPGYGYGYGPQYRYGRQPQQPPKPLDEAQARQEVENYLKSTRNPNLKVGKIEDRGNLFEVSIEIKEGSLVDKLLVDKDTGRMQSAY